MKAKITIALLSLSIGIAHAAALDPAHFPADLIYKDKPIDPLCFFNLESSAEDIALKNCGIEKNKYKISGTNAELTKQGFYGFDWQDTSANYPSGGLSYYKVWDAGNKKYWVYTVNNGGGSGDFTSINLFSRTSPDKVSLKTIDGGDRCNGGIGDVIEKDHGLQYSVNITANDFLVIAKDNPHNLKAYDDLSACAACCAAKAYYTVDLNLKPKLEYVDLGTNAKANEMSGQGTYHECFNKIFSSYVTKGKTKLNEAEVKQFVSEFNQTCVKK